MIARNLVVAVLALCLVSSPQLAHAQEIDGQKLHAYLYSNVHPPRPDPGGPANLRSWWETWTMVGCNRTFDVMMDFIPDGKGTTIVQPMGQIQERLP